MAGPLRLPPKAAEWVEARTLRLCSAGFRFEMRIDCLGPDLGNALSFSDF